MNGPGRTLLLLAAPPVAAANELPVETDSLKEAVVDALLDDEIRRATEAGPTGVPADMLPPAVRSAVGLEAGTASASRGLHRARPSVPRAWQSTRSKIACNGAATLRLRDLGRYDDPLASRATGAFVLDLC